MQWVGITIKILLAVSQLVTNLDNFLIDQDEVFVCCVSLIIEIIIDGCHCPSITIQ